MMMRAALILGGLGILIAMELGTPPRAGKAAVERPLALLMPEAGNARDTLTPADRLAVTHLLYDAPFQPASPAEKISPATDSRDTANNVDSRGAGAAPAAVVLSRPRPRPAAPRLAESRLAESRPAESRLAESKPAESKPAESKRAESRHAAAKPAKPPKAAGPDRPRAITETGSCANAFAGLLKALSLPTGCDT
jgi:hypothetical protein